ncbi:RNA-directed DNA polymerase, eukaryota, reverse transcriptase zinc-binding domain protein [Tanacetum coccineum]
MGLWYPKDSGFELTAFSDADHAGCLDTRKSTSGGIQFLGDKLVSWMSKKQNCTAMSSAEAEYVALSASCAQVMWMRTQLQDYGFNYNKIPLYCDSQSAIAISCKAVQYSHTKHIHTRPFREDKCLIRRENQCFIVLLSGALFQPHRRRDILSFMEHLKMEMEISCSNKIKFITACSFSNDSFKDIMKAQVYVIKASATLNIQAFKIKKKEGKAGLRSRSKHTCMDDVAITSVALPKSMDGIAYDTGGEGFKFGKSCSSKDILNNLVGPPLFSFHFGRNENSNPFSKKSQLNSYKPWNLGKINGFGPSLFYKNSASNSWADKTKVMNADCSINIDSFAQKINKGMEDRELQMNHVPQFVSMQDDGTKRIMFSLEDIKAGSVACSLQLYGYFVGTFMDYMVVNANLSRMWRKYGIIGKPMLMDKLTRERCLNKSGKLDFARVLMEVSSKEELHHTLTIAYPAMGDKPARVGRLVVKYQWKPPLCTHCKTFGHSTSVCKSRPRFEEEMAFVSQDGKKVDNGKSYSNKDDNEGFVIVRRKKRLVNVKGNASQDSPQNVNHGFKSKVNSSSIKNVKQDNKPSQSHNGSFNKGVRNSDSRFISNLEKMGNKYVPVDHLNFKPKVLVRGSNSKNALDGVHMEDVSVSNSFQALDDQELKEKDEASVAAIEEEYSNVTESQLMQEVIDVMKSGVYPSPEIKMSWSLSQVSFFYNNCHKYGLEPSFEDDDIASKEACMADEMRPENIIVKGQGMSNDIDKVIEQVKKHKLSRICSKVFGNWQLVSNSDACAIGTGIIVGWDPNSVRVMVLNHLSQLMNVLIETVNGHHLFFCTFVYAQGTIVGRRTLWKDLVIHSRVVKDSHWVLLRDFNCILDPYERSIGSSAIIHGMADFRECLAKIEVSDLVMLGLKYTWNKSLGNPNGLLKKLDKVMSNIGFIKIFSNANAQFLPFVVSDDTPSNKPDFLPIIKSIWDMKIPGYYMFSIISKLKLLKKRLRKLWNSQGKLADKVKFLNSELERIQTAMVNDSHNADLRFEEVVYLNAYKETVKDEEIILKQRAKVTWLSEDLDGNGFSGDQVGAQFVKYFQGIFGESSHVSPIIDPASLFSTSLSLEEANFMVRHVFKLEIKYAFFGMEDDKAPGPDGFSAKFFKAAWPIIGDELKKGSAKVKWEDVCQLKVHGGLGIKSLHTWNVSLMAKHIWNIVSKKDSLWVKWVNSYRVGNGVDISAWFDNWLQIGLVIFWKIWNRSGMFNGETEDSRQSDEMARYW